MRWLATAALSVGLLASVDARAADPVPETTGDFVAFCTADHYPACRERAVAMNVAAMAEVLVKHDLTHSCGWGDSSQTDDATRKILAWLAVHKETYGLPTSKGIMAAMDQLWPCPQ